MPLEGNVSGSRPTWRQRIRAAADAVDTAYCFRAAEFRRAHDAGLSIRQIAEAAEMSATGVHKAMGSVGAARMSLDSEAPERLPSPDTKAR